jgi:transposase
MITLPNLGEMDRASGVRIWLATQPADMRCGFDRLAALAQSLTGQDPLSGQLFIFRGRGGDRLKILYWDRDGFCLWYKRLEEGVFKLPRVAVDTYSLQLRPSELAMLLEGIDLASVKRLKRYRPPETPPAPGAAAR